MTLLGWAVYFGHSGQAEEVIKWAVALSNINPFLPMREGFFRGKTAKEIAEYYQRKNLMQMIEQCEKTRDESMRLAGETLRRQLEAEKPTAGKTVAMIRPKRDTQFAPVDTLLDKKTRGNDVPLPRAQSSSSPIPPAAASPTSIAEPSVFVKDHALMSASSLSSKAGLDVDTVKRGTTSGSQRLTVQRAGLVTSKLPSNSSLPVTQPEPTRAPSPLVEDPAERVPIQGVETTIIPSKTQDTSSVAPSVAAGAALSPIGLRPGKKYHVLLSYSWGKHQITRSRARLLSRILESRGLRVWLTEDHVEDDVLDVINQGVEESELVIVCLTKGYADRIASFAKNKSSHLDWCVAEFNQSYSAIARAKMMTVVMDPIMFDYNRWVGDIALALKGLEVVDFTTDKDWDEVAAKIEEVVRKGA